MTTTMATNNPCGRCGARPATRHSATMTYLCRGCAFRLRHAKPTGVVFEVLLRAGAGAVALGVMMAAAVGFWALLVFALGVAP